MHARDKSLVTADDHHHQQVGNHHHVDQAEHQQHNLGLGDSGPYCKKRTIDQMRQFNAKLVDVNDLRNDKPYV